MAAIRLLFVDDEPSLRLTLPEILKMHNFEVHSAATVAEALNHINSAKFDVLVADLNIGEPGDGFTVVSAMRRTQPHCVNIILTGYPAFESALEAIRSQVDDYLVKPCDAETLVNAIETRLKNPQPQRRLPAKRLAAFLRKNIDIVAGQVVQMMKAHRKLGALKLTDQQRLNNLRELLVSVTGTLETESSEISASGRAQAWEHGRTRREQGYSITMLVDDTRLLEQVVYHLVQENLLELDLSYLINDLRRLNDSLENKLQESITAYLENKAA